MTDVSNELFEVVEDTQRNKYLTFAIENESYGIEISHVTEIIGIQSITVLPELPEFIKGIINLRGKIIPVMDVRLRFKKESLDYNDRTCIVVIDINEISIGLIVDTVSEVLSISEGDVVPPPDLKNGHSSRYVKGIGKVGSDVKLILNCDRLLKDEELDLLSNVTH